MKRLISWNRQTVVWLSVSGIVFSLALAWGIRLSSTRMIPADVIDAGGSRTSSASRVLYSAIGQSTATGETASLTMKKQSGYIYQIADQLPTPTPTAVMNTLLDLTVLLHGVYDANNPGQSRGVAGDYGVAVELRDYADGSGSNYRYYGVALDANGAVEGGPLDLGVIVPGNYYVAVSQLNHLAVVTDAALTFAQDSTVVINLSDPLSADFVSVEGDTLYQETDGTLSLKSGNGHVDGIGARAINTLDAYVWMQANGSTPGSPNWNIMADYDANGMINVLDANKWLECNGAQTGIEIAPLDVRIIFPVDNTTTTESIITVTGTVNDNNATIEVNGITAEVAGGTFTVEDITLPVIGNNQITVTAGDSTGAMEQDEITVIRQ